MSDKPIDINFHIFEITASNKESIDDNLKYLRFVFACDTYSQAVSWIQNDADEDKEYTIIEVVKKGSS